MWIVPALLAWLAWGCVGYFSKVASFTLSPRSAIAYTIIGMAIAGFPTMLFFWPSETNGRGMLAAMLGGACIVLGEIAFIMALNRGKSPVVVSLTALYPLCTLMLAMLLLGERISVREGIGIALALVSMLVLTL